MDNQLGFKGKGLMLDCGSSDASMSASESYELTGSAIMLKRAGIKVLADGIRNENTGESYGYINSEEIKLKEQIGYGAGGSVYLAIHEPSGTLLAIKSLNVYDKEKRQQLLSELSSLNDSIQWNELVQFYGAYYYDGRVRLVLEYMNWGSLRSFMETIKQQCPGQVPLWPEYVIGRWAFQLLKALEFLHKQRHQIHRDMKPENILVNNFGEFKLTDFGISKQLMNTLNLCKTFVGTLAYMSPERMNSETYTYPSDIWSLGLIIYEMAMGEFWYPECKTFIEMRETVLNTDPPKLPEDGTFSEGMQNFLAWWLQIEPQHRFSASDLLTHPWIEQHVNIESEVIQWVSELMELKEQINKEKKVSEDDIEKLGLNDLIGLK